jgi:hypothetical protein
VRAHVEIVDEKDYIWHPSELIKGQGEALQKNLSYDEEDGSVSGRIRFVSDWGRPGGVHHAETEWYVQTGEVKIGDTTLLAGDYWMAPTGVYTPQITVKAGTEILYFREYGDWGFDVTDRDREFVREDQHLKIHRTSQMPWIPVAPDAGEGGSPMRFDLGGVPVPGLSIKMLHRDEKTGFYTRLIKAKPGWVEHPLAHHPCYEEAYCVDGGFQYNYGEMWEGTYFWRPALIRHGDFTAALDTGCTWLMRCDGDLVDWYTEDARMEMHGTATNWGPDYPGSVAPRIFEPVRSRSIGPMEDPFYQ